MSFRIVYINPRTPVPEPERFETYSLKSALYDYRPKGIGAKLEIDGYSLDLRTPDLKFVDLVRNCLPLAEQLNTLPPDHWQNIRKYIPDLPEGFRVYEWLFVDFYAWLPKILFATDGTVVRIYTRTLAETAGNPLIVWEERDRAEPVIVPRREVIEEIRSFLTQYLDDLSSAFTFILEDEMYLDWRKRLAALG
jgi:hypothetical protein